MKGSAGRAPVGQMMTPGEGAAMAAAAGLAEAREPRPYRTRYPIPDADFVRFKERARTAKLPKGKATLIADSARKQAEPAATAGAPRVAEVAMAPASAPTLSGGFAGIAATGWIPPDCTMAAGPEHVLLSVNSSVAIYPKAGGAPLLSRTLTQWFANVVQDLTIFDPKALYDQHDRRWVLLAVAFTESAPKRSVFLLSVSESANLLGQWRNYVLDAMVDGKKKTKNWADYPAIGVDDDALYLTANMFAFGGDFQYAKIRVVPKKGPYSGGPAPFVDFVRMKNSDASLAFTIQPCHTFGAPKVEYLVNTPYPDGKSLTLWRITNPATPALTRASVPISAFSLPPNAEQSGGAPPLNTGDVRVLHAVFRGDSLWAAFTTRRNWGAGNRASIHWVQVRAAVNALVQEGVYGARDRHYFYPAACPDNNGNLLMVFSSSARSQFGSIGLTGRRSTDPLGSLQSSTLIKSGVAHYQALDGGGRNRWGDYTGVAADPANTRVVWFYNEFASAADTWGTWVGAASF